MSFLLILSNVYSLLKSRRNIFIPPKNHNNIVIGYGGGKISIKIYDIVSIHYIIIPIWSTRVPIFFGRPVFKCSYINSLIYQILTTQAYTYLSTVWIRLAVLWLSGSIRVRDRIQVVTVIILSLFYKPIITTSKLWTGWTQTCKCSKCTLPVYKFYLNLLS